MGAIPASVYALVDMNDPLTALRIPVTIPQIGNFLVTFDVESEARPTDAEAAMLASYIAWEVDHYYNDTWKTRLAAEPFDVDMGYNTTTYHKYGEGSWGYRSFSWTQPFFAPGPHDNPQPLIEVIERQWGKFQPPSWRAWKADRPAIFGEMPGA